MKELAQLADVINCALEEVSDDLRPLDPSDTEMIPEQFIISTYAILFSDGCNKLTSERLKALIAYRIGFCAITQRYCAIRSVQYSTSASNKDITAICVENDFA